MNLVDTFRHKSACGSINASAASRQMVRSARGHSTDDQAVAVLHQCVAQESQPPLRTRPFAIETGIVVGGRGMRVVAAFAMEVRRAIAARSRASAKVRPIAAVMLSRGAIPGYAGRVAADAPSSPGRLV